MARINILDELTANKIAAGEVVDRPASVVKELVENSLDAGSTIVEIRVSGGGLEAITVSDNGEGMSAEDAPLAFQRHATSKINSDSDLDSIITLGFRGEALPSIAAVARVELRTRRHDDVAGTYLILEGGRIVEEDAVGCPAGTTITVMQLFTNTPARLKNIKSASLEIGHISDVVTRMAIAYPEVSFSLVHEKRVLLRTNGSGDLLSVIAAVYGTEAARSLLRIEAEQDNIKINGFIAKPTLTRANRNHQTFIINKRVVRSRQLSQALEEGYHSLIMGGRHPAAFLNITLPHSLVDPNVHPAKTEVRLYSQEQVCDLITKVARTALVGGNLIPAARPSVTSQKGSSQEEQYFQHSLESRINTPLVKEPLLNYDGSEKFQDNVVEKIEDQIEEKIVDQIEETLEDKHEQKSKDNNELNFEDENEENFRDKNGEKFEEKYLYRDEPAYTAERVIFSEMRPLGQIDNTYIVLQSPGGGFYLVDQHAAHERILYERNMQADLENVSQLLAIPDNLELTHLEAQILIEHILDFHQLGFLVEHFGGDSFILRAVPTGFQPGAGKKIFLDLLDYFFQNQHKLTNKELREGLLIMMSCKSAVKAGDRLTLGQMEQLLADLEKTEIPFTCPHGRPTVVHITPYELEKMFKRVL